MAGKKAKRPGPRYLLSADQKLQKLSLRKLAQPRAKATSQKRTPRASTPAARATDTLQWPWTANPGAIGLAGLGILAAATLFAAGQMSDRTEAANVTPLVSEARFVSDAPAPAPIRVEKLPAQPVEKPPVPSKERPPVGEKTPAPKPTIAAATVTSAPAPVTAPKSEDAPADSVTITGCLAKSNDGFTIKDASGGDLLKKRSWRSGFFKKSTPRVDIASSAVPLSEYVGQRVAATGLLADKEFHARSVRRLASACD